MPCGLLAFVGGNRSVTTPVFSSPGWLLTACGAIHNSVLVLRTAGQVMLYYKFSQERVAVGSTAWMPAFVLHIVQMVIQGADNEADIGA